MIGSFIGCFNGFHSQVRVLLSLLLVSCLQTISEIIHNGFLYGLFPFWPCSDNIRIAHGCFLHSLVHVRQYYEKLMVCRHRLAMVSDIAWFCFCIGATYRSDDIIYITHDGFLHGSLHVFQINITDNAR